MIYKKIKENILYAGMNDEDRLIFDELIPLDHGTSYNSYIVIGSEKTAVIDTMYPKFTKEYLGGLFMNIFKRRISLILSVVMLATAILPIIVVFEDIQTEDSVNPTGGYLTYEAPTANTQREKEGIDECIVLPNGVSIQLKDSTGKPVLAPMAIYQVGLRANNDFETEGTH